jgi:hypothetical protein
MYCYFLGVRISVLIEELVKSDWEHFIFFHIPVAVAVIFLIEGTVFFFKLRVV